DFTTFIPTTADKTMPPWLPRTRLYVGLERFGLRSAAGVIEARVAEIGGLPHQETVVERAERFARAQDLRKIQAEFQNNAEGVMAAERSYADFSEQLQEKCRSVAGIGLKIDFSESGSYRILSGLMPCNAICEF